MIRCDNCGMPLEDQDRMALPLYCPGCEDYFNWKRDEKEREVMEPIETAEELGDSGRVVKLDKEQTRQLRARFASLNKDPLTLIYLASPLTHSDPSVRQDRFERVCRCAAVLIKQGVFLYSPIAHHFPIALYGDIGGGWDFWEFQDRSMLNLCKELWVLDIPGWTESKGVLAEIRIARELGLSIRLVSEDGVILNSLIDGENCMIYTCEKCGKVMHEASEAIGHKCCIVITVSSRNMDDIGMVYSARTEGIDDGTCSERYAEAVGRLIIDNPDLFNIEIR